MPEFKNIIIKKTKLGEDISIPTPPHYLSQIEDAREYVEGGGTRLKSLRKPIFVEVNDYRKVIEEIRSIKKDSKKSKELVKSLDDFKIKNSAKIEKWGRGLEKIQRDLVFMDKILFEEVGWS